jgi:Icc-related predicted phosphoesterase
MLLVADVHGEFDALGAVASLGEPLLILGDLLNFVDYRTHEGMLAEVGGKAFVAELADMRNRGDTDGARARWREFAAGREDEIRERYDTLIRDAYTEMATALRGATAYVTYGNVDRPDLLREMLPPGSSFVDGEVIELDGYLIGFAGGGMPALGGPGEVAGDAMEGKLASLPDVDILCTHVPPAIPQLSTDVVGGRPKGSAAVLGYLEERQPRWHYFGDIHQPQATRWLVGRTLCRNVGYFRATRRPVRHG